MIICCASMATDGPPERAPSVDEREAQVLYTLAREGDATVAFQGLRHRLGLHQQILARTLRRLDSDGLVVKSDDGYRLTEDGYRALGALAKTYGPGACNAGVCSTGGDVLPVMQLILPPHADADALADALKGRWFKDLRWFGESRAPDETTLTWILPTGVTLLRVRIAGGAVTVEAEGDGGAPEKAFLAAPALLGALADAFAAAGFAHDVAAS